MYGIAAAIPQNYNEGTGAERERAGERLLIEISIRVLGIVCRATWQWFFFLAPFKLRARAHQFRVSPIVAARTFLAGPRLNAGCCERPFAARCPCALPISQFLLVWVLWVLLLLSRFVVAACVLRLMIKMHLQFQQ